MVVVIDGGDGDDDGGCCWNEIRAARCANVDEFVSE